MLLALAALWPDDAPGSSSVAELAANAGLANAPGGYLLSAPSARGACLVGLLRLFASEPAISTLVAPTVTLDRKKHGTIVAGPPNGNAGDAALGRCFHGRILGTAALNHVVTPPHTLAHSSLTHRCAGAVGS